MNLESVAERLELDGVGWRGSDIFVSHLPTEVERGILLRHSYTGTPIDPELPGYRNTRFSVATRAKTYKEGVDLMWAVINSITVARVQMTNMDVKLIRARTEPIPFPMSPAGMFEFLVIFEAVYVIVG